MTTSEREIRIPALPSLVLAPRFAVWLGIDGELLQISHAEAAERLRAGPCLVVHARAISRRLRLDGIAAVDILELFAFVRPARFCLPTPRGLAEALMLAPPRDHEDEALVLPSAAVSLLEELADNDRDLSARPIAETMRNCGWAWGDAVLQALGAEDLPPSGPPSAIWATATGPVAAEWVAGMAQVGGMVRTCARAARRKQARRGQGGAGKAGGIAWRWSGSAAKPGGLCGRCFICFHAA